MFRLSHSFSILFFTRLWCCWKVVCVCRLQSSLEPLSVHKEMTLGCRNFLECVHSTTLHHTNVKFPFSSPKWALSGSFCWCRCHIRSEIIASIPPTFTSWRTTHGKYVNWPQPAGTFGEFKLLYNAQGPCFDLWGQSRACSDIGEVRIMAVRIREGLLYLHICDCVLIFICFNFIDREGRPLQEVGVHAS